MGVLSIASPPYEMFDAGQLVAVWSACIATLLAAVLNINILHVLYNDRELWAQSSNRLLFNLAVGDFGIAITTGVPFWVNGIARGFVIGQPGCGLFAVGSVLFVVEGLLTLGIVAAERYFVVVRRQKFGGFQNYLIVATWIFSTAVALAPLLGWGEVVLHPGGTLCVHPWWSHHPRDVSYTVTLLLTLIVPLNLTFASYKKIFDFVKHNAYTPQNLKMLVSPVASPHGSRNGPRTTNMLMTATLASAAAALAERAIVSPRHSPNHSPAHSRGGSPVGTKDADSAVVRRLPHRYDAGSRQVQ